MTEIFNKLSNDYLSNMLMNIYKNSSKEDIDITDKHIDICINDREYNYKYDEELRNELINLVDKYIQYGKNSIEWYKENKDLCMKGRVFDPSDFFEAKKYLINMYDTENKWDQIKEDLNNLIYTPNIFINNINNLKYKVKLNKENKSEEDLEKWRNIINMLENNTVKENIEAFINITEEVCSEKLKDESLAKEWNKIKLKLN